MGMSLKERISRLSPDKRLAWVASQPPEILAEAARNEWWYVGRPEQTPPSGEWNVCLVLSGRGFGKASSIYIDLPLRKPGGDFAFAQLKDVEIGDEVLDERGRPCRVLAITEYTPEVAYRFEFSDGTHVDSCSEHQWVTWTHAERKRYLRSGPQTEFPADWAALAPVRTTQEIVDTLTYGKRGDRNHCIPLTAPLELPERRLPLDPWLFGYWLGNGARNTGILTTHGEDAGEVYGRVRAAGFVASRRDDSGDVNRSRINVRGLVPILREMDVLGDKHVPQDYLWGSVEQRRALLAGLLDSDGYLGARDSSVEFCSTEQRLAEAVLHLARSLGEKPVLGTGRATLNGVDYGEKFRVCWRPSVNPFWSARKSVAFRPLKAGVLRSRHRKIMAARRITPGPMRCLMVDSPNSMFLIGEGLVPTHNSRLASEWLVQRCLDFPHDRSGFPTEWLVVAAKLDDARKINIEGASGVKRILDRRGIRYHYTKHPKPMITLLKTPGFDVDVDEVKIHFQGADSPDVGRGFNAAGAILDEIAKWPYPEESWLEGILPSLRADLPGDHPRTLVTTTPKPLPLLREWIGADDGSVSVIRGSTFDNKANLSGHFLTTVERKYKGTRLGAQELYGELLDDIDGALWSWSMIENNRVSSMEGIQVVHTTVGVDPTLTEDGDLMGVVVVARSASNHMYVLADESVPATKRKAADHVWRVFEKWGADTIAIEDNIAKDWLDQVLTDSFHDLKTQDHYFEDIFNPHNVVKRIDSRKGKKVRAEPVAMRYEQNTVHHCGTFADLEEEMLRFDPADTRKSPDRMDALVHACRHLMKGEARKVRIASPARRKLPRHRVAATY